MSAIISSSTIPSSAPRSARPVAFAPSTPPDSLFEHDVVTRYVPRPTVGYQAQMGALVVPPRAYPTRDAVTTARAARGGRGAVAASPGYSSFHPLESIEHDPRTSEPLLDEPPARHALATALVLRALTSRQRAVFARAARLGDAGAASGTLGADALARTAPDATRPAPTLQSGGVDALAALIRRQRAIADAAHAYRAVGPSVTSNLRPGPGRIAISSGPETRWERMLRAEPA